MQTLWQDLRFGLQMLAKNPGFSAIAVLTMALGIGAKTALFSVVDAVPLKKLPVKDRQTVREVHGNLPLKACFIPARRGTRVDPLAALRHE